LIFPRSSSGVGAQEERSWLLLKIMITGQYPTKELLLNGPMRSQSIRYRPKNSTFRSPLLKVIMPIVFSLRLSIIPFVLVIHRPSLPLPGCLCTHFLWFFVAASFDGKVYVDPVCGILLSQSYVSLTVLSLMRDWSYETALLSLVEPDRLPNAKPCTMFTIWFIRGIVSWFLIHIFSSCIQKAW